jgi:hypothetical protein
MDSQAVLYEWTKAVKAVKAVKAKDFKELERG